MPSMNQLSLDWRAERPDSPIPIILTRVWPSITQTLGSSAVILGFCMKTAVFTLGSNAPGLTSSWLFYPIIV